MLYVDPAQPPELRKICSLVIDAAQFLSGTALAGVDLVSLTGSAYSRG